jgi:ssDNA-binding Zn-finger/Zn-ribbon topoisomerase 1
MARQPKTQRSCPECGGPLKRTIGAASRTKFWVCIDKGDVCFRKPVVNGK